MPLAAAAARSLRPGLGWQLPAMVLQQERTPAGSWYAAAVIAQAAPAVVRHWPLLVAQPLLARPVVLPMLPQAA